MMFGDVDDFAIEAEFLSTHGKWIYGELRFWVGGRPFGDPEDTSDLASSARWGRTFLNNSQCRTRADLDRKSASEVYELLYGRFIVPIHSTVSKPYVTEPWDSDAHILDEVGESAVRDDCAVLAVRRADGMDRLIAFEFEDEVLVEALLAPGVCDAVVDEYCTWVESMGPV